MIAKNIRTNNEFYVAPVYNEMISIGKKIDIFNIGEPGNGMHGLGTPTDLNAFLKLSLLQCYQETTDENYFTSRLLEVTSREKHNKCLQRSFSLGFGTETDIRDLKGELVISHDMPKGDEMRLEKFLALVSSYEDANSLTLALNIKSDGLLVPLKTILAKYKHLDIFVFDMSVPDSRSYLNSIYPHLCE